MRPSLCIVIPTLEEARVLPGLLADLTARRGEDAPDGIVVSDGRSRDGSAELARRWGATVVSGPPGRGAQLARGAEHARGELLLFLHADSRLEAGSLAAVRRVFRDPTLVAAGFPQRIDHPARLYRWIERAADLRVRRGWIYGDSGLICRTEAYRAVGGFRPLPLFEDLDLSRRLRRRGRIGLVPGARIRISPRRWERDGVVRRTVLNWALTLAWAAGIDPARLARFYPPHSGADPS